MAETHLHSVLKNIPQQGSTLLTFVLSWTIVSLYLGVKRAACDGQTAQVMQQNCYGAVVYYAVPQRGAPEAQRQCFLILNPFSLQAELQQSTVS